MSSNKSMIRIPTSVIMGQGIDTQEAFGLYVILKSMTKGASHKITIKGGDLAKRVGIKDSRTIKNRLEILEAEGLVSMSRVYRANANIDFMVNPLSGETFTQIDSTTFHKICLFSKYSISKGVTKDRMNYALRLYYYLAHRYNPEYGRAFPSYDKINEDIGISFNLTADLLNLLEEIGVLEIKRGRMLTKRDEYNRPDWRRESNSYIPIAAESVYKDLETIKKMKCVDIDLLKHELNK